MLNNGSFFLTRCSREEGRQLRCTQSWKSCTFRLKKKNLTSRRSPDTSCQTGPRCKDDVCGETPNCCGSSRPPKRASVNSSNINTNWQMEAESHAALLSSTDLCTPLSQKRMHSVYHPLQWRVIPDPPARGKRESGNIHELSGIIFIITISFRSHLELRVRAPVRATLCKLR